MSTPIPVTFPAIADALRCLVSGAGTGEEGARRPNLLDDAELLRFVDVRAVLEEAAAALAGYRPGTVWRADLTRLEPKAGALIVSMLGDGEVAARVGPARIQETALQGVWLVDDGAGALSLEVADVPSLLRDAVRAGTPVLVPPMPDTLPEGVMNVAPILAEIRDHMARLEAGEAGDHEINLTLLPVTPTDHAVLARVLGVGTVDILSRGYGNCRAFTCALRHVWRIQFFNSEDTRILDLLHIGEVPVAARATEEDIAESADRLRELIGAYFPDTAGRA
jgi:hydrogenase-1 operon protein HyaF